MANDQVNSIFKLIRPNYYNFILARFQVIQKEHNFGLSQYIEELYPKSEINQLIFSQIRRTVNDYEVIIEKDSKLKEKTESLSEDFIFILDDYVKKKYEKDSIFCLTYNETIEVINNGKKLNSLRRLACKEIEINNPNGLKLFLLSRASKGDKSKLADRDILINKRKIVVYEAYREILDRQSNLNSIVIEHSKKDLANSFDDDQILMSDIESSRYDDYCILKKSNIQIPIVDGEELTYLNQILGYSIKRIYYQRCYLHYFQGLDLLPFLKSNSSTLKSLKSGECYYSEFVNNSVVDLLIDIVESANCFVAILFTDEKQAFSLHMQTLFDSFKNQIDGKGLRIDFFYKDEIDNISLGKLDLSTHFIILSLTIENEILIDICQRIVSKYAYSTFTAVTLMKQCDKKEVLNLIKKRQTHINLEIEKNKLERERIIKESIKREVQKKQRIIKLEQENILFCFSEPFDFRQEMAYLKMEKEYELLNYLEEERDEIFAYVDTEENDEFDVINEEIEYVIEPTNSEKYPKYVGYYTPKEYLLNNPKQYPILNVPQFGCIVRSYQRGKSMKRGYKEKSFEESLYYIFSNHFLILGDVCLSTSDHSRPYEPDIALIDNNSGLNIRIDIEIDEPYSIPGREPCHYIGVDDDRDQWFKERGWIVIRFSEKQVHLYPNECISHIIDFVRKIGINISKESFKDYNLRIFNDTRWSIADSLKYSYDYYRENYLQKSFNGVNQDVNGSIQNITISDCEINEEKQVIKTMSNNRFGKIPSTRPPKLHSDSVKKIVSSYIDLTTSKVAALRYTGLSMQEKNQIILFIEIQNKLKIIDGFLKSFNPSQSVIYKKQFDFESYYGLYQKYLDYTYIYYEPLNIMQKNKYNEVLKYLPSIDNRIRNISIEIKQAPKVYENLIHEINKLDM